MDEKTLKLPIRFKFDIDKFISVVCYFASQNIGNMDKLKVCKLLYYADKQHILKFGKPITGDSYFRLDNGPVPSRALDIMNEVICGDKVLFDKKNSNKEKFLDYIKVKKTKTHPHPVFEAIKKPNLDFLSASEQESLRDILQRYGKYNPGQLINLTHKDVCWRNTENNQEIDYRLFFEDQPDGKKEALEYMETLAVDSQILSILD